MLYGQRERSNDGAYDVIITMPVKEVKAVITIQNRRRVYHLQIYKTEDFD